ncbi:hypothetical protein BST97_09115 [Nonlabens spongiae]|uniref:Uncharacterized protein n=1 Tax=Nonlabens spongiae TaxID=331648 RepID=A0A1W6MKJ7_9FLAO|nr:hypothetical protein [Nonlabens spongiae]ARN78144.1 hypothetical protein BST97_09115 [Nonlabens spongiae]
MKFSFITFPVNRLAYDNSDYFLSIDMRRINLISVIYLLIVVVTMSCQSVLIKSQINRDIAKNASYFKKDNQRVIYLPMMHIAKPTNYDNVRIFIEEKREKGYVVYYETVKFDENKPDAEETKLKMRRLTGLTFGENVLSNEQQAIFEILDPDKYVLQKQYDYGLRPEIDVHADFYLKDLVALFEEQYHKVVLDNCDYNTPMNQKYDCNRKDYYKEVVHDLRNEKLMTHILDSTVSKKLIVYGEGHFWFAFYSNIERTYGFEEVKRKNWVD